MAHDEMNTTTEVITLATLAGQINEAHSQCKNSFREGTQNAIRAGQLLIEAKALCPRGEWGQWVRDNCEFSNRTAEAYMRVAREMPRLLEAKAQRVADLSFRETLKLLGAPKDHPEQSELEAAEQLAAEFDAAYLEWSSVAELCREILGNPNAASEQVKAVRDVASLWEGRFAELKIRYQRELGRVLGLLKGTL